MSPPSSREAIQTIADLVQVYDEQGQERSSQDVLTQLLKIVEMVKLLESHNGPDVGLHAALQSQVKKQVADIVAVLRSGLEARLGFVLGRYYRGFCAETDVEIAGLEPGPRRAKLEWEKECAAKLYERFVRKGGSL